MAAILTSKDLLQLTGISRATLNNYIALGILARPRVARGTAPGGPTRIGYFAEEAVERIREAQRLKASGLAMSDVAARLRPQAETAASLAAGVPPGAAGAAAGERAPADQPIASPVASPLPGLRLTVDELSYPAYLVNANFQVDWWNDAAAERLFGRARGLAAEIETRSVFQLLLEAAFLRRSGEWRELLLFHAGLAKTRLPPETVPRLFGRPAPVDAALLDELYQEAASVWSRPIAERSLALARPDGQVEELRLYASFFREGIFFVYAPSEADARGLLELLAQRQQVIRSLLRRRLPYLTPLVVLALQLQAAERLAAELAPEDFFQLVNDCWGALDPLARPHHAAQARHWGSGMVYFFFPQPDRDHHFNAIAFAIAVRQAIARVNRAWQARRPWLPPLAVNQGLADGREWFGAFQTAGSFEFVALGDATARAVRLATFAQGGAVLAAKSVLAAMPAALQAQVRFGTRRGDAAGQVTVPGAFAALANLAGMAEPLNAEDATLAVTEVFDLNEQAAP
ncbi:MAG: hypothetical protein FJX68_05580 [Alphaproteobacteria bacterium]|nr:hypothetical protein [Alphaproteobacteria bacterium]